jgi:hypothetical protein
MIGITVSTNYADILPYVVEANLPHLDYWIVVTDRNDVATQQILAPHPKIVVLYWDFQNNNRVFDKGGAVKFAQEVAYKLWPDSWYLILDSDICLGQDFVIDTSGLDPNTLYGLLTRNLYYTLSNYKNQTPNEEYKNGRPLGFFQLYKKHCFYKHSVSASECDDEFAVYNFDQQVTQDKSCSHLGQIYNNHNGRKVVDFVIDV